PDGALSFAPRALDDGRDGLLDVRIIHADGEPQLRHQMWANCAAAKVFGLSALAATAFDLVDGDAKVLAFVEDALERRLNRLETFTTNDGDDHLHGTLQRRTRFRPRRNGTRAHHARAGRARRARRTPVPAARRRP